MADDPTLVTLAQLQDPLKYRLVRNVPVFKKHERKTADGTIVVTDDDLQAVAESSQKLIDDDGTLSRITIGHIDPKALEVNQPPITGYVARYYVGTFSPTNQKAVLCDMYVKVADYATVTQFPYRSVEYYPQTKEIRGVALLKRDSFLSLGALTYHQPPAGAYLRHGQSAYSLSYSLPRGAVAIHFEEPDMPDEIPDAPVDAVDADPNEQEYAKIMAYLLKQPAFAYMMSCYEASVAAAQPAEGAEQLDNGPAAPSASNASIPGKKDDEMERMANDQLMIRLSRLEADNAALKAANAETVKKADRSECERMIVQLEAQGYQLDRPYEVDLLANTPTASRKQRIEYIAKHYQQSANGQPMIQTYEGAVEGGARKRTTADATKADAVKAAELCSNSPTPITYQAALAQVMGIGV